MTRYDYLKALERAFAEFRDKLIEEIEPELGQGELDMANDELMLCVYEHTGDSRRA